MECEHTYVYLYISYDRVLQNFNTIRKVQRGRWGIKCRYVYLHFVESQLSIEKSLIFRVLILPTTNRILHSRMPSENTALVLKTPSPAIWLKHYQSNLMLTLSHSWSLNQGIRLKRRGDERGEKGNIRIVVRETEYRREKEGKRKMWKKRKSMQTEVDLNLPFPHVWHFLNKGHEAPE